MFKNTTTNIINVSDKVTDEFKDIQELENSLHELFNEIRLYLFNIAINHKKKNKYFNFIIHQLKNITIHFNDNDKYLGIQNNKGEVACIIIALDRKEKKDNALEDEETMLVLKKIPIVSIIDFFDILEFTRIKPELSSHQEPLLTYHEKYGII